MRIDLTHDEEDFAVDPSLITVGYFNGMRIVVDVYTKDVYYEVIPKSMFNYEDALFKDRLKPLSILPKKEAVEVTDWLEEIGGEKKIMELKEALGI